MASNVVVPRRLLLRRTAVVLAVRGYRRLSSALYLSCSLVIRLAVFRHVSTSILFYGYDSPSCLKKFKRVLANFTEYINIHNTDIEGF
jgi:hypothetical protein